MVLDFDRVVEPRASWVVVKVLQGTSYRLNWRDLTVGNALQLSGFGNRASRWHLFAAGAAGLGTGLMGTKLVPHWSAAWRCGALTHTGPTLEDLSSRNSDEAWKQLCSS